MRHAFLPTLPLMLLAGCRTTAGPSPSPTQALATQARLSPAPTRTSIPATHEPTATPTEGAPATLSEEGPWWVYHSPEGIWAVNPDGSGLSLILNRTGQPNPLDAVYRYAPSPAGGLLALIEIESHKAMSPPWLRLLSVPGGQLTTVVQLHPEMSERATDEVLVDRWAAAGVWNRMSWSPDGRWLAFNAVIDGDTGDLYLYSVEQQALSRLTDGPTETVFPVWSPDGRRIIHGAVERLYYSYSGAGYDYTGVWSAGIDGRDPDLLFSTRVTGFEQVLGWLSDTSMLMVTHVPNDMLPCAYHGLRTFDVVSRAERTLLQGPFGPVAFDPRSGVALLGMPEDPLCPQALSPGIYWLDVHSTNAPMQVVEGAVETINWSEEAGLFLAETPFGGLAVDTAGQYIDLVVPERTVWPPRVAPGSTRLAWETVDQLWLGTLQDNLDSQPRLIHDGRIDALSWSPDGRHLLFMSGSLYVASEPDFAPVQVLEGPGGYAPVWLMPAAG